MRGQTTYRACTVCSATRWRSVARDQVGRDGRSECLVVAPGCSRNRWAYEDAGRGPAGGVLGSSPALPALESVLAASSLRRGASRRQALSFEKRRSIEQCSRARSSQRQRRVVTAAQRTSRWTRRLGADERDPTDKATRVVMIRCRIRLHSRRRSGGLPESLFRMGTALVSWSERLMTSELETAIRSRYP